MKMTKTIAAVSYKNKKVIDVNEEVVSDETTKLIINNEISRSFSTIPDSLKEFAVGYILGEGLIDNISDIKKIKIDKNTIHIIANLKKESIPDEKELITVSDSAGGWRSKIKSIEKINSNLAIDKDDLINNMEKLRKNALIWQKTGGTHVAAIINDDKFIVKEDVSRHVAVDKVIGAGALEKFNFERSYIIYSGRMPADMLIKIARVGIPILASNSAPSFSGYTIANEANITMIGFIRNDRFNIYTYPERIIFSK